MYEFQLTTILPVLEFAEVFTLFTGVGTTSVVEEEAVNCLLLKTDAITREADKMEMPPLLFSGKKMVLFEESNTLSYKFRKLLFI